MRYLQGIGRNAGVDRQNYLTEERSKNWTAKSLLTEMGSCRRVIHADNGSTKLGDKAGSGTDTMALGKRAYYTDTLLRC
jgi:hypothetical protein